jgi:hypothetical protein
MLPATAATNSDQRPGFGAAYITQTRAAKTGQRLSGPGYFDRLEPGDQSPVFAGLRAAALCAAFLPDLSLSTMNCGSSGDAATLWDLIFVGLVTFFTTSPTASPPLDCHFTLSPTCGSGPDFFPISRPFHSARDAVNTQRCAPDRYFQITQVTSIGSSFTRTSDDRQPKEHA